MTTKQICDAISTVAMALTDKEHSLEYKLGWIESKYSNSDAPDEVVQHICDVLTCTSRK